MTNNQLINFFDERLNELIRKIEGSKSPYETEYFPVWNKESMVKRQNITAKIPDELALTAMYGANMDQLKDFANPGSQFADKEGVAAAGLYNNQLDEDKKQLDIAFKNNNTKGIGVKMLKPDVYNPLRARADGPGDNIETFIKKHSKELETAYEERLKKVEKGGRF